MQGSLFHPDREGNETSFNTWPEIEEVFRMKRIFALILAVMLVACSALTAFAEDTNTNQPPQMSGGAPEGTPPEPPEGGFPGESDGMGPPPDLPEGGMMGGPGMGNPPARPDGQPGGRMRLVPGLADPRGHEQRRHAGRHYGPPPARPGVAAPGRLPDGIRAGAGDLSVPDVYGRFCTIFSGK